MRPEVGAATREPSLRARDEEQLLGRFGVCAWVALADTLEVKFVSRALAAILELPSARAPMHLEELSLPADHARLRDAMREVASDGKPRAIEYRAFTSSGRLVAFAAELRRASISGGPTREVSAVVVERSLASAFSLGAFEACPIGLAVIDRRGTLVTWNAEFAELWRAPAALRAPDLLLRHVAAQLEHGKDFLASVQCLARDPDAPPTEMLVDLFDGRVFECTSRPLAEARLWSFRDVTRRVVLERELREREQRFRDLYNKTPVIMHSIDPVGTLVSVSDAWLGALGYERDEVIGHKSIDFLTPESRQYANDVVLPVFFRTGECKDVHYRIRKKNDEIIDVLLSAIVERAPDGAIVRSLAVMVDVTEHMRASAERNRLLVTESAARGEAEEALALLDTLFYSAPVGLAFLDRDLRYVRVNETLSKLHGLGPGRDIGRTLWEAAPSVASSVAPLLLRTMESGEPIRNVQVDGEFPAFPNETRSFLVSYYPVRTAGGDVVGVGAVVVDVTEQKRAAALQARLYSEAREAIRVRDDFLAAASHEFRTPMTPLALYLRVIEGKLRAGDKVDPALVEKALSQLAKLSALISDLLDSSLVELGRLAIHPERVSLRAIVKDVVAVGIGSTTHGIELRLPADDLVVQGDRQRLAQVVTTLLDNAVKYSRDGEEIQVVLELRDGKAALSITDRGIGIPPEQLPQLFERFFRGQNAPITNYGGLGLGLYICRDVVERHGGRIWAESRLGEGSTFHVVLPLATS